VRLGSATPSRLVLREALLGIHTGRNGIARPPARADEKDPCAVGSSSGALVVPVLVVPVVVVVDTPVLAFEVVKMVDREVRDRLVAGVLDRQRQVRVLREFLLAREVRADDGDGEISSVVCVWRLPPQEATPAARSTPRTDPDSSAAFRERAVRSALLQRPRATTTHPTSPIRLCPPSSGISLGRGYERRLWVGTAPHHITFRSGRESGCGLCPTKGDGSGESKIGQIRSDRAFLRPKFSIRAGRRLMS